MTLDKSLVNRNSLGLQPFEPGVSLARADNNQQMRTMNPEQDLIKQLKTSPKAELLGVVGASGVVGFSADGKSPWTLLLPFSAWKEPGGKLQKTALIVRKKVPEAEMDRVQDAVEPFDVLRVKVRLAKESVLEGSPQALLIALVGKDDSDAEVLAFAKHLQEPVTFRDSQFGLFTLDRRVNWYEARTKWGSLPVRLVIDAHKPKTMEKALTVARSLWACRKEWQQRIAKYATEKLLPLKNESWLGEDETELTAREFAKRMAVETICVRANGSFEFWYSDGDLFWGHSIRVSGNLTGGPKHADIEG